MTKKITQKTRETLKAIGRVVATKKKAIAKEKGEPIELWHERTGFSKYLFARLERGETISLATLLELLTELDIELSLDPKIGIWGGKK